MATPENKEQLGQRYPFFRVVGPPGVGKSTLAKPLAEDFGAYLLDEPFTENPFLEGFYTKNPADFSFDAQMFFLVTDALSTKKLALVLPNQPGLADAGEEDNKIIAKVHRKMGWMTDVDYDSYTRTHEKIYGDASIPKPDMYFAVKAKTKTIVRRIEERGRPMELRMLEKYPEYFPMLVREFNVWLRHAKKTHFIREIDSDKYNIVFDEAARNYVLEEARNWARYYVGRDGSGLILPGSLRPRHHIRDIVPNAPAESTKFRR